MRINKFIAETGFASRRQVDKLVEDGRVKVNGKPAEMGMSVSRQDSITIDGKHIDTAKPKTVYLAYNKPVGVISTSDPSAHDNIIDAVNYPERVFHIGRLDVASSGLILLTNDGDIVNKILRGEEGHEKEYVVTVEKPLTRRFIDAMRNGIVIDGRRTKPARVKKISDTRFHITLTEGRNRQIRKMCAAFGYDVKKLKRIRIMNIKLGTLGEGNWRHLTKTERNELLHATG